MITPDSIPNPPAPAGANGSININNDINAQYNSRGFIIGGMGAAITSIKNVAVWAPTETNFVGPTFGYINYGYPLLGAFVSPGTMNFTSVSSLSVAMVGSQPFGVNVYGNNGQLLNIAPIVQQTSSGQTWTFTGADITSFSAFQNNNNTPSTPWGVASVSFTPATASAPEPSTLALAGIGLLGLATRFGWRHRRHVA